MKGWSDDAASATGRVGGMMVEPVQAATFDTLTVSGPSTMSRVHCTVPLTGPKAGGGRACPG